MQPICSVPEASEEPELHQHSQTHILQPPSRALPCHGTLGRFPAAMDRSAACTGQPDRGAHRGAPHWDWTPNTDPGRGSQLGPCLGEVAPDGPRGAGLTAPLTTPTCGAAARGGEPTRSSQLCASRTQRTQGTQEAPGWRGSSPASPRGTLIPSTRRGFFVGSPSTEEPWGFPGGKSGGPGDAAVGARPQAFGAPCGRGRSSPYLPSRRLLWGLRVRAAHPRGSAGPGHLGRAGMRERRGRRGLCPRAGGRPGLRALRAALHVTAARTARCGPEGGGLAAGAAGSQARAPSRAGLGAELRSQGRGRGSGRGRGGGGGGRARGPAGEELRLAAAWLRGHPGNGPNRAPWACDDLALCVSETGIRPSSQGFLRIKSVIFTGCH